MTAVQRWELDDAAGIPDLLTAVRSATSPQDLAPAVAETIARVRADGDAALVEDARRFGAPDFTLRQVVVTEAECDAAARAMPAGLYSSALTPTGSPRTAPPMPMARGSSKSWAAAGESIRLALSAAVIWNSTRSSKSFSVWRSNQRLAVLKESAQTSTWMPCAGPSRNSCCNSLSGLPACPSPLSLNENE